MANIINSGAKYGAFYGNESLNEKLANAVINNLIYLIPYYIERGADLHMHDDSLLIEAANHGYNDIIRYMLAKGISARTDTAASAINGAIPGGHIDTIKLLMNNGTSVHVAGTFVNPLDQAAIYGKVDIAKLLIEHKADIHRNSERALIWAVDYCQPGTVKLLIESNADINAIDQYLLDILAKRMRNGSFLCADVAHILHHYGVNV